MVDVASNGTEVVRHDLPETLRISALDAQRVPSPGTQRALRAQTGKDWGALMGPEADGADRFQTIIWVHLRKRFPGLLWEDCAEVDVIIDDGAPVDPTNPSGSALSPYSAVSGG